MHGAARRYHCGKPERRRGRARRHTRYHGHMRLAPLLFAPCLWLACAAGALAADAGAAAPAERLAARLATLATGARVTIAGEELVSHRVVPRVYEATGGRLLWQDPAALGALLAAIEEAADDGLRPEDYHARALARLAADGAAGGAASVDVDLLATDAYVMLLYDLYLGKVDPLSIEPNWKLPGRPVREQQALDFVVGALGSGQIREAAARVRPHHWLYEHGRAALARYRGIARDGGWATVGRGPKLVPGARDARVPELRRRLAASGDYSGAAGDSPDYDEATVAAVRVFQRRHLLAADGEVGAPTLRELNVPVAARIDQLRINLERGRWVLHEIGDEDLVVVDIAGYGVRYLRNRQVIWRGRAIVGQPYRQTPQFRAEIEDVVFNPTWTVPPASSPGTCCRRCSAARTCSATSGSRCSTATARRSTRRRCRGRSTPWRTSRTCSARTPATTTRSAG